MSDATLLLGHGMTLVEGAGYLAVAEALRRRAVPKAWAATAWLFRWWWLLIGVNKLVAAASGLLWWKGLEGDDAYFAALYVNLLILCVSLACLLCYFAFLLWGSPRVFPWVIGSYVAFYLLLTYNLAASHPYAVGAGTWRTFHVSEGSPGVRSLLVFVLLLLPQLLAALAYLSLAFRVGDRTSVYRIVLVALSVVAWTFSIFLVALPTFDASAGLQVASRLLGLGGAALALLAYRPPRFLRRLLRLAAVDEVARRQPVPAGSEPLSASGADSAFREAS